MKPKHTTFPHFIGVGNLSEPSQRFWLNANLIEQIGSSNFLTAKSHLVMQDGRDIYVTETPEEIFKRIYNNTYFLLSHPDEP